MFYASGHPQPGSRLPNPLGFMVSTDGGDTWQPRSLQGAADFHAMAVHPTNGDVIYAWNGFGRPGLYHSTDAGRTWNTVTVDAFDHPLALAGHPDDPQWVWAGTEQGLLRSTDTGRTWQPVSTGAPITAVTFDPATPGRVLAYAAEPGDGLIETLDDGRTWRELGWTLPGSAVSHLTIDTADPAHLHAATYGRDILESHNSGRTWRPLAKTAHPSASPTPPDAGAPGSSVPARLVQCDVSGPRQQERA